MNGVARRRIELQDRDIELLKDLFQVRLMTLAHASALHFEGRFEAAKKRIQKLKAVALVGERPRRPYEPSILFLARAGFELLRDRGALASYPSLTLPGFENRSQVKNLTLRHELEVMDVKAAIVSDVRSSNFLGLVEFSTWPQLYCFEADQPNGRTVTVKPDGFIRINEHSSIGENHEHSYFLEVDRSTETLETLALKAHCYRDYYRRGGFAMKNGRPRSEYESFPFRVLMVFRNSERRNNVAERLLLLSPPIMTQVWLTTFAETTDNPLGAIWVRPFDYRAVTQGTRFEPSRKTTFAIYRRQSDRESIIEQQITKHHLFAASGYPPHDPVHAQ